MIGATERQIASVATGSGSDRISKSAVVDSLREATKTLEPQLAASVQSTALSQLQADAQGSCTREEVARVWLTNVLPALERVPLRNATGGLGTRKLTQVLQHMTHGRLSQVMLDELPAAQDALGLSIDGTGGGELPNELVQPLVATLTAAALRATVHELGDSLLSLPGLEKLGALTEAATTRLGRPEMVEVAAAAARTATLRAGQGQSPRRMRSRPPKGSSGGCSRGRCMAITLHSRSPCPATTTPRRPVSSSMRRRRR